MADVNNYIGLLMAANTGAEARPIIVSIATGMHENFVIEDLQGEITTFKADADAARLYAITLIAELRSCLDDLLSAGSEDAEEA